MGLIKQTITLPIEAERPVKLQDWEEISFLVKKDHKVSKTDITDGIERYETDQDGTDLIDKIWAEIELRKLILADSYPFELNNAGVLTVKDSSNINWAYVFCLLISYVGIQEGHNLGWW